MSERPAPVRGVLLLPSPDGRFAILDRERLSAEIVPPRCLEDTLPAMAQLAATLTWLSEHDARAELAALGLSAPAVDERIAAARRRLDVWSSAPTVMERITKIGYRNADGQQVIRKTSVVGAEAQRVFVLACTVCGHEYGAYGCDVDIRRCPSCQDGPPGVSLALR